MILGTGLEWIMMVPKLTMEGGDKIFRIFLEQQQKNVTSIICLLLKQMLIKWKGQEGLKEKQG